MTLKDLMKEANKVLKLDINWEDSNDENYNQLFKCANIRLNDLVGENFEADSIFEEKYEKLVLYGIIAEYAFICGIFDIWKEYETKYDQTIKNLLERMPYHKTSTDFN